MKFIKICISKISITVWLCFCAVFSLVLATSALPTPWSAGFGYAENQMIRARAFVYNHGGQYSHSFELGFVPAKIESGASPDSVYGTTVNVEMFRQMLAAKLLHNPVVYSDGSELVMTADPSPGFDTAVYRAVITIPDTYPLLVTGSHVISKQGVVPGTIEISWNVYVGLAWVRYIAVFAGVLFLVLASVSLAVWGSFRAFR
jgi:hypothetical protein